MRLGRFRRRRSLAAICRARSVLATARPISAIAVTLAWAGAEAVVAGTPVRAICIGATLEADQTVLVGVAADQAIAAIELRRAHIPTGVHLHREAGAIQLDASRFAPAFETGLAFAAIDRVILVPVAALVIVGASAIAADRALDAVVIRGALGAVPAVADAVLAVTVVAAFAAHAAAAVPISLAAVVIAAFGAGATVGLMVVAAGESITARAVQMITSGIDSITPGALDAAATLGLSGAILAVAADLASAAVVLAMTVVATLAVAAVFVTAAFGAIAAIAAEIVVISARAAMLVLAAAGFTPAVVAILAGAIALPVIATLHTVISIATGGGRLAFVWRTDRRTTVGLVEAGQAVPAIARGTRAMPIPTIAVLAAVGAANPMLVIDTTGKPIAFAEAAIYDNLAGRILAATFRTNEAAI